MAIVLSEIAATASETLELDQVFDRLAASVRKLIACDHMSVVRIVAGERAVVHATTDPRRFPGASARELPLAAWSPRWRPQPELPTRVEDAEQELDTSFPLDQEALEQGLGSALWEPFRQGSASSAVSGCPRRRSARSATSISSWPADRRAPRLGGPALDGLGCRAPPPGTARRTRDAARDSGGVARRGRDLPAPLGRDQGLLPHDLVNLTETDLQARTIRITASAGDFPVRTDVFPLTEQEVEEQGGLRDRRRHPRRAGAGHGAPPVDPRVRHALLAPRPGLAGG